MASKLIFCPHCGFDVAERTYRRHKGEHFDIRNDTWSIDKDDEYLVETETKRAKLSQQEAEYILVSQDADPGESVEDGLIDSRENEHIEFTDEEADVTLKPIDNFVIGKLEEVWEDISPEDVLEDLSSTEADESYNHLRSENLHITEMAKWTIYFVTSWAHKFNISATAQRYLLLFLQAFSRACGIFSPMMNSLAAIIPTSNYMIRKSFECLHDDFLKYAACPECDSVYDLCDCKNGKRCTYIQNANHPQRRLRQPCGIDMCKEITLKGGTIRHYPFKTFCYRPVKQYIKSFLDRPGFQQSCEAWRHRITVPGSYRDVYDGRVWKSFQNYNDIPFLQMPRRYGLMLNIDWFQPYKHSPYSCGAIYLSLMNLPRSERFKSENMIVAGVIPGPDEPSKTTNSYLKVLVDELVDLWENGFKYRAKDDSKDEDYYLALLCCACDVPAIRKVCGILGHAAKAGCSKCKKKFKTGKFGEKMDYGGFEPCEQRTNVEHRRVAEDIRQQNTITARQNLESQHGVRYTELMRLEYFDCISFPVVDPMHNLFQGTAKYMFKTIWSDKLSKEALKKIQDIVDNISVPAMLGHIPRKIKSSFSSFTSEQWMNWTLYFSPIALKGVLPNRDYNCWLLFVEACRLLCQPSLKIQNLRDGHEKLMGFCRTFERLYGSVAVTPNMHLHTHLVQCILDYGPFHSFWLFAFERMNGVLGSFRTNQRSPEIQLMRNISRSQLIKDMSPPVYLNELFASSLEFNKCKGKETKNAKVALNLQRLDENNIHQDPDWLKNPDIKYCGPRYNASITDHFLVFLRIAVSTIVDIDSSHVSGNCFKYHSCEMCGETFGSSNSRLERSSVVLASWCGAEGDIYKSGFALRPAVIRFFVTFYVEVNGSQQSLHFAFVHWFQKVTYEYGPMVSLWCRNLFEPEGPACFLPMQRVYCKAICGPVKVQRETVLAVVPHLRQLYY